MPYRGTIKSDSASWRLELEIDISGEPTEIMRFGNSGYSRVPFLDYDVRYTQLQSMGSLLEYMSME